MSDKQSKATGFWAPCFQPPKLGRQPSIKFVELGSQQCQHKASPQELVGNPGSYGHFIYCRREWDQGISGLIAGMNSYNPWMPKAFKHAFGILISSHNTAQLLPFECIGGPWPQDQPKHYQTSTFPVRGRGLWSSEFGFELLTLHVTSRPPE